NSPRGGTTTISNTAQSTSASLQQDMAKRAKSANMPATRSTRSKTAYRNTPLAGTGFMDRETDPPPLYSARGELGSGDIDTLSPARLPGLGGRVPASPARPAPVGGTNAGSGSFRGIPVGGLGAGSTSTSTATSASVGGASIIASRRRSLEKDPTVPSGGSKVKPGSFAGYSTTATGSPPAGVGPMGTLFFGTSATGNSMITGKGSGYKVPPWNKTPLLPLPRTGSREGGDSGGRKS
ncbi:hypothetical protein HK104_004423, partial [Borealophlyctis nickersoniae]